MKKFPIALISGIALIIITGIAFLLAYQDTTLELMHYLTMGGVILSELITTGYASTTKGSPRKVAAAVVSAILIPVSIVLAFAFADSDKVISYVCLYSGALVLLNAIALVLIMMNSSRTAQDNQVQAAKDNMNRMRQLVKCIAVAPAAQPYAVRLQALEENMRFSNDAVIAAEDNGINQLLNQLQTSVFNNGSDIESLLSQLEQLVARRKTLNRYSK